MAQQSPRWQPPMTPVNAPMYVLPTSSMFQPYPIYPSRPVQMFMPPLFSHTQSAIPPPTMYPVNVSGKFSWFFYFLC